MLLQVRSQQSTIADRDAVVERLAADLANERAARAGDTESLEAQLQKVGTEVRCAQTKKAVPADASKGKTVECRLPGC